jgi:hypothetical protein
VQIEHLPFAQLAQQGKAQFFFGKPQRGNSLQRNHLQMKPGPMPPL